MKCHMVYSVPIGDSITNKLLFRVKRMLQNIGVPISLIGPRINRNTAAWPTKSPFTNTKNMYERFSLKMPTFLYHLSEKIKIEFDADDIFIGHPMFPYSAGARGVTELSVDQKPRPRIFSLISPLHCNIECQTSHINKSYLDAVDALIGKCDVLFAIMGQYWWDRWDYSPYAHWKSKMVRLDMAVDPQFYPRVKTGFNPPGKRGYLYIGQNNPLKGTTLLSQLFAKLGEFPRGWIGYGPDIPGVPRISPHRALTPDFMGEVAKSYDFFITTGIGDANPTTILESMAWGLPVICTPQSGYYETTYLRNIFHEDISKSTEVLRELQYAREDDLMRMADEARRVVETEYTWDKFTSTIFSILQIN